MRERRGEGGMLRVDVATVIEKERGEKKEDEYTDERREEKRRF